MPTITQYVCQPEFLPTIECALAAHGYRIDIRGQPSANCTTALVMTRGLTSILLSAASHQALAAIEIWGLGQSLAAQLLESLPLELYKPSAVSLAALSEADAATQAG